MPPELEPAEAFDPSAPGSIPGGGANAPCVACASVPDVALLCDACAAALTSSLLADPAIAASLAAWVERNAPEVQHAKPMTATEVAMLDAAAHPRRFASQQNPPTNEANR